MSWPVRLAGDSLPAALPDLPAFFSPCRRYRYWLARDIGGAERGPALFILHNPSTADATADDPTIRRCIGYARRWRCRRMIAVNRFAVRGTDPGVVFAAAALDPVGPLNEAAIARAAAVVTAAARDRRRRLGRLRRQRGAAPVLPPARRGRGRTPRRRRAARPRADPRWPPPPPALSQGRRPPATMAADDNAAG